VTVEILTASVEVPRAELGAYAPQSKTVAASFEALVARIGREIAADLLSRSHADDDVELELRASFLRLESDTEDHPFASVRLLVEVCRRKTGQAIYTRQAEAETRRLLQPPVPIDDARFERTALGRATLSCLRGVFAALVETFLVA
jgi:hypothetical protein